jgi:hypothetical protein
MLDTMKTRSVRIACLWILVSTISGSAMLMGQNDPNIFVNITSSQDKAADNKFGKEYHEYLRTMMENRMFKGIKAAYPCIHYLDQSALKAMIGVERMRELLGADGESRLAGIGAAVGASHLGWTQVTVTGDNVTISGGMMQTSTSKTVGRAVVTVPAGASNDAAIMSAMTQFVSKLISSAGSDGPKCGGWQGEISASSSQHQSGKNPNGDSFSTDADLKITCDFTPGNSEPACQVSYSYKMAGKSSSISNSAGGSAQCVASANIFNGKGQVTVGPCQVMVTSSISVEGTAVTDKQTISLGGWEVAFPAPRDAKQLSGARQVDKYTTVNWNLTYVQK